MKEKEDQLFNAIAELLKSRNQLAKQALGGFRYEISEIIRTKNHDKIEHLFDRMLDYCFDDEVLVEYKRILRYYYPIDPESVAFHVGHYRKMYDSEEIEEE
jgi:hypothetical protein